MNHTTLLAIDLAKNVFQLHCMNGHQISFRKTVRRAQLSAFTAQLPTTTIVMEACGGAHAWGRLFSSQGHTVKLIAPQFVKPFVKGNKTDRNDAEAIATAALQPNMRFVALKTVEQQQVLALHRLRSAAVKARTALSNQLRGLLLEFGIAIPTGLSHLRRALVEYVETDALPALLCTALVEQHQRLNGLDTDVERLTKQITHLAQQDARCVALMQHRGVGPLIASAFCAEVANPRVFNNGRQVAAWLGLVPRQHSSGGKPVLLGISKRGDAYLRTLLIHGARAAARTAPRHDDANSRWVLNVQQRRGTHKAIVALANKMARQLWAQLAQHPLNYA